MIANAVESIKLEADETRGRVIDREIERDVPCNSESERVEENIKICLKRGTLARESSTCMKALLPIAATDSLDSC